MREGTKRRTRPRRDPSLTCQSNSARRPWRSLRSFGLISVSLARAARQTGRPAHSATLVGVLSRRRPRRSCRPVCRDAGNRKLPADFVALIERVAPCAVSKPALQVSHALAMTSSCMIRTFIVLRCVVFVACREAERVIRKGYKDVYAKKLLFSPGGRLIVLCRRHRVHPWS